MSRVIKFLLKMIIAAGIVVGVIFLVSYFISPKADATKISRTESEYNLSQKIENSYSGFKRTDDTIVKSVVDMMPEAPSQYFANTKTDMLPASKKVSDVFVAYYQYYVSASCYVNKDNSKWQSSIIGQMQKLNAQVDKTIEYLEFMDKYAKVKNYNTSYYSNDNVFFARLDKWVESYQKQTEILMNLTEELRKYVCETNYQTGIAEFKYAGEAKLEIVKDYAKAVFVDALNGKLKTEAEINPILRDETGASFENTYQKFIAKINSTVSPDFANLFADSNKASENNMFLFYGEILKNNLFNAQFDTSSTQKQNLIAGFYQLSSAYAEVKYQKTRYFYDESLNISDAQKNFYCSRFIDQYYDENLSSDAERRNEYIAAQNQYLFLNSLYNYLLGASL